jgi:ADP-heptose:LPS heptosyltransferase
MIIKTDCRHFHGDRPCAPHKETGIKCDNCTEYKPISLKILIIKLDAVGDVLRTTSILKPLKRKYPDSYITWCTRQNSKELFKYNLLVDDVIVIEDDARFRIIAEEFDLVINLDTSKLSSAIASDTNSINKIGFVLNKKGYVEATSAETTQWLEMSAFDDIKKSNIKSYQLIMYEILQFNMSVEPPILPITDTEKRKIAAKEFNNDIKPGLPLIGLNIGVGTKWPSKGWPLNRWQELVTELQQKKYNLLLLCGPEEKDISKQLLSNNNFLIDTGCENSLLEFTAIVDLCDVIITSDTLALHIATALEKKIVAFFGPTSINEIELYGKGVKLSSTEDCKCFYRKYCSENVSCMEKISTHKVIGAVNSLLTK